jgi:hypothetical protein
MMTRKQTTARLQFIYAGKAYTVILNSINYTENVIVNKLEIGYAGYWLILQKGVWKFIGDMPLCQEVKDIVINKVKIYHGLSLDAEIVVTDKTHPVSSIRLLKTILNLDFHDEKVEAGL